MNIKSYLINLDRSEDRLDRFKKIAMDLGLNLVRIPAVDGREISSEALVKYNNPSPRFYQLGPGEIGCFLSHRKVWEVIIQDGADWAAVFEDDVHISKDSTQLLSDLSWIPSNVDIVKLETTHKPVTIGTVVSEVGYTKYPRKLARLLSRHGGTAGYLISRSAAETLLRDPETLRDPLDQYMFNPVSPVFNQMTIVQVCPALCIQDENLMEGRSNASLKSTLHDERDRKKPKGLAKVWREISRPFIRLSENLKSRASNLATVEFRGRIDFK